MSSTPPTTILTGQQSEKEIRDPNVITDVIPLGELDQALLDAHIEAIHLNQYGDSDHGHAFFPPGTTSQEDKRQYVLSACPGIIDALRDAYREDSSFLKDAINRQLSYHGTLASRERNPGRE